MFRRWKTVKGRSDSESCLMNKSNLVTFASWEERFVLGLEANLNQFQLGTVCVLYFDEYKEDTARNRGVVESLVEGVNFVMLRADDPASTWKKSIETVSELARGSEELFVDVSTMPREIVWYVLWAAEQAGVGVRCLYYSPKDYGDEWLSRDPRAPRMAFKLSGMADPSKATALLVTEGFDEQRVWRLVNWCEPDRLMVGVQEGGRFKRNEDVMRNALREFTREPGWDVFKLDAFGPRFGEVEILEQLGGVSDTHNVILASMGPKLTALALYRIQRRYEDMGLVYAPAGQYNKTYSRGIGEFYSCRMNIEEG